jgi:hypothetical protein
MKALELLLCIMLLLFLISFVLTYHSIYLELNSLQNRAETLTQDTLPERQQSDLELVALTNHSIVKSVQSILITTLASLVVSFYLGVTVSRRAGQKEAALAASIR